MAKGIKTPGTFVPGTKGGVVVESKHVKGGYITVADLAERDALLNTDVVTPGTKVFVEDEAVEYVYKANTFTGKEEFQDSLQETVKAVEERGFVTADSVDQKVEDAVAEKVPELVNATMDTKLDAVTEQITQEATEAAKKETLEKVESSLENDYVKTERLDDYYTKEAVDRKLTGLYRFKGSVRDYGALLEKSSEAVSGDTYNLLDTGMNYAWVAPTDDKAGFWDALGTIATDVYGSFDIE